jgi:hypothetical protein
MPPGVTPEDVAEAAVGAGQRFTIMPARLRRIDYDLAQHGVNWSLPELAALDPGKSDSRLAGRDWVYTAVQLMLTGGEGIDMGMIGALFRTLAPTGGVAPLAGQVEYRWPISRDAEPAGLPDAEELLGDMLGGGDFRDQGRDLAMTVPVAELQDAFHLAAALPGWADGVCAAVEREISAGQLSEATKGWVTSAFGLSRLLLVIGLKDQGVGPGSLAITALVLIFIRNKIRVLRQFLPAENFDVLNNPFVAPSFLIDFLDR